MAPISRCSQCFFFTGIGSGITTILILLACGMVKSKSGNTILSLILSLEVIHDYSLDPPKEGLE